MSHDFVKIESFRVPKSKIKKWVDALYSGKYRQGKGVLKTDLGSYCCLGVLCEVITGSSSVVGCAPNTSRGAEPWMTKVNNHFRNLHGENNHKDLCLMQLNDNKGYTFDEIADLLYWTYERGAFE